MRSDFADIVWQIVQLVEMQVAVHPGILRHARENPGHGRRVGSLENPGLFILRKGAIPENVCVIGWEQRAIKEPLELVLKADLVV